MKNLIIQYRVLLAGAILGAIAGYAYYYFIGCASGTCAITSKPVNSSLYGALMGALLADSFRKEKKDKENAEKDS